MVIGCFLWRFLTSQGSSQSWYSLEASIQSSHLGKFFFYLFSPNEPSAAKLGLACINQMCCGGKSYLVSFNVGSIMLISKFATVCTQIICLGSFIIPTKRGECPKALTFFLDCFSVAAARQVSCRLKFRFFFHGFPYRTLLSLPQRAKSCGFSSK